VWRNSISTDEPGQVSSPEAPQELTWTNQRLVAACLEGSEPAWSALVDKYKRLIFSIPIKYGYAREDAADIFQAVCMELFSELPRLRNPEALPKWLMQVTAHKCLQMREQASHLPPANDVAPPESSAPAPQMEKMLLETEREQILRGAMLRLKARCRELVEMLFFEEPPRPYDEVAKTLGLATGSIGFIRGRCLEQLRRELAKDGF
jgi:RNA polymerase sigma factor (sigma-70 family)